MSCSSFQLWVVSDDADDRRLAEEHAAVCTECRQILVGQQILRDRVSEWVDVVELPEHLEAGIRESIAEVARRPVVGTRADTSAGKPKARSKLWIALAASFLLGIGLGVFKIPAAGDAPQQTRRLLDAGALEIAEEEEAAQRRAISNLEERVEPILAGARDKEVASRKAARLMEFSSRLAALNVAIDDVRGFVQKNPGHPRARTMLLDAYKEKKDVLREVIALEERSS